MINVQGPLGDKGMTGAPGLPGKDGEPGIRGKFVKYFLEQLYYFMIVE